MGQAAAQAGIVKHHKVIVHKIDIGLNIGSAHFKGYFISLFNTNRKFVQKGNHHGK
ncbi:conserved hypothetical protein [delta proteobacterium NaphS2]|nr:conserved hypothetical protein [delta proteobacterium NaphS2]